MRAYQFQPLTVKGLLSQSMLLYRENFLKLIGIAVPGAVIGSLAFQSIWIYGPSQVLEIALLYIGIAAFQSLIVTAAGVIAISDGLLGQSIRVGQAYSRVASSLFPLLGALTLFTIAISIGLPTFVLGVVAYVWFCLAAPVVMIEGEGGSGALKRSRIIVKGHFKRACVVVVLVTIVQVLVTILLLSLPRFTGNLPGLPSLFSLLSVCLFLFIEPFKVVSTTMLYYDLRVRKEGYNLQTMAEELTASSR